MRKVNGRISVFRNAASVASPKPKPASSMVGMAQTRFLLRIASRAHMI
jgi:hypothetical protein